MQFAYEAMRADGTTVIDVIEAGARPEAVESLREKGLMLLRLDEQAPASAGRGGRNLPSSGKLTTSDLILFTRQMKMLLEAGSPLVPALEAVQTQTAKPVLRDLLARLRERVEGGESLSRALEWEHRHFDPVFCSMVAAGEATASLAQVFGRLSVLARQRQQNQKMVIGALLYPAVLSVLMLGVINILLFFVVPRFRMLFANLHSPLPTTTKILFELSVWLRTGWPFLLGAVAVLVAGAIVGYRLPQARHVLDELVLRLPVIGRLVSRLIFARVVRVWAAMLRCHVPLLDVIRQSRDAVANTTMLRLLSDLEEAVAAGGRVGPALAAAGLTDPIIVSAIRTGEDNGRLAEATDFVSTWLDEDNTTAVQNLTRMAEPVLLAGMGLVVGSVAMALFVPLFDMATAAG